MSTQPIVQKITAKDWNVLEQPLPKQAPPEVAALLDSSDAQVRELAVQALDKMGGPVAKDALFRALTDRADLVRAGAARAILKHGTADDVQRIIGQLRTSDDDYVREHMALLLGNLGQAPAVEPLQQRMKIETYPHAKHAMSLALAKLGDAEQRQAYVKSLQADDPKARAAALDDLLYLQDRELALAARGLLTDTRDARNVAPSHGKLNIRVCDVAINVLDQVLNHPFPFPVEYAKRYMPSEIQSADQTLRKLK